MGKNQSIKRRNNSRSRFIFRTIIFILTWCALVGIGLYDKDIIGSLHVDYREGEPADKDIYSPFAFTYVNQLETDQKREYERDYP